jgi:hypothetical protein
MQPDELRRAIEGPAELAGCGFEPGLVDELVEQVGGQPGTLTWQAFKELGGVEGALASRADAILKQHYAAPERRDDLRRILLRLVQPGEGAADTRRRVPLADLAPAAGSIEDVQALLQPLADARLIVISRTGNREPRTGEHRTQNKELVNNRPRTTDYGQRTTDKRWSRWRTRR